MREVFDFIVSSWDVTEFAVVNWLIVGLLGPFVYMISFRITGEIANEIGRISILMSLIHWIIRFIIYFGIVWILKASIFIISLPITFFGIDSPRFWSSIISCMTLLILSAKTKFSTKMNNKIFWR